MPMMRTEKTATSAISAGVKRVNADDLFGEAVDGLSLSVMKEEKDGGHFPSQWMGVRSGYGSSPVAGQQQQQRCNG